MSRADYVLIFIIVLLAAAALHKVRHGGAACGDCQNCRNRKECEKKRK